MQQVNEPPSKEINEVKKDDSTISKKDSVFTTNTKQEQPQQPQQPQQPTSTTTQTNRQSKKRKPSIACVYCRRSHMICDDSRPCKRCIKRDIGHLCHDKSEKPDKQLVPSIQVQPTITPIPSTFFQSLPSATALNQQPFFYSEHAGSEFNSLTEFLSMIDDNDMMDSIHLANDPMLQKLDAASYIGLADQPLDDQHQQIQLHQQLQPPPQPQQQQQQQAPPPPQFQSQLQAPPPPQTQPTTTPHVSDAARDKFFLTAADPTTEISPEERLKQVINAKLEAGLLKPYDYAKGYQRLQTYMDKYMAPSSRSRILKPLGTFRPGFRAIAKTLKDIDLILVEESFERMLLDYDRVFTAMAIPACLWRRTGEIYRGNKEFASLVEVSTEDLKNGKLTVYELMTEESSVNFWEKYGSIAFDKTQKAVLTSCNLRTRDGRRKKNCCFSFTIRRDRYNIPSCIVGNFIPIR